MKASHLNYIFFIVATLLTGGAYAGESGYIKNGVTHIVYKEGKKVGDWPTKEQRDPAAISQGGFELQYQDDGNIRCYSNWVSGKAIALSCVKK